MFRLTILASAVYTNKPLGAIRYFLKYDLFWFDLIVCFIWTSLEHFSVDLMQCDNINLKNNVKLLHFNQKMSLEFLNFRIKYKQNLDKLIPNKAKQIKILFQKISITSA